MKWLGKGVLSYAKKDIMPGDDIPKGIGKEVLEKMIAKGLVGELPVKVKPGQRLDDALEQNTHLAFIIEGLEMEKKVLLERVDVLEKDAGDLKALEKEVAELTKKLGKAGK